MRKILNKIVLLSVMTFGVLATAQKTEKDLKKEEAKEMLKKMSPEERMKLFEKVKIERVIKELNIPAENQEEIRQLFKEYSESKRAIIGKFKPNDNTEQLSDKEARKKIAEDLEIMQKVLDNRKKYTDKFLKKLTPQQVLKVFKIEHKFKEEFDRKHKKNEELKMKN